MRIEHTRQTRWGHDPEAIDQDRIPPGSTYVKQMIWVPCTECDLQVHATYAQLLTTGVVCPECGQTVAAPVSPGAPEAVRKISEEEERFRRQL